MVMRKRKRKRRRRRRRRLFLLLTIWIYHSVKNKYLHFYISSPLLPPDIVNKRWSKSCKIGFVVLEIWGHFWLSLLRIIDFVILKAMSSLHDCVYFTIFFGSAIVLVFLCCLAKYKILILLSNLTWPNDRLQFWVHSGKRVEHTVIMIIKKRINPKCRTIEMHFIHHWLWK